MNRNVLLLMDNVFRFVQAGAEVSGMLGRLPSRVGYQPTLATEIAELEERIASVAGAAGDRYPGGICAGRRLHRSRGGGNFSPSGFVGRPVARHGRQRDYIPPSIRSIRPRCCSIRAS